MQAGRQSQHACDVDLDETQRACIKELMSVSVREIQDVCVGKYLAIRRLLSV